jgi:hypothetical protein
MAGTQVPRDPSLSPETRRFLDDLARRQETANIFYNLTATQATALLDVFTSALKGLVPASGGGTTTFLRADGTFAAVPADALPAGTVLQVLQNQYTTNTDLTTDLPIDDTVPTSTEGDSVLSQAITLASSSNKVLIDVNVWGGAAAGANVAMALFRSTTCIAANGWEISAAGAHRSGSLKFLETPGSVGPHTYSVRVGTNTPTLRLNGTGTARLFGGVGVSTLTLMEIKG